MRTIGSGRMYPDFFTENDALKGHGEGVRESLAIDIDTDRP